MLGCSGSWQSAEYDVEMRVPRQARHWRTNEPLTMNEDLGATQREGRGTSRLIGARRPTYQGRQDVEDDIAGADDYRKVWMAKVGAAAVTAAAAAASPAAGGSSRARWLVADGEARGRRARPWGGPLSSAAASCARR